MKIVNLIKADFFINPENYGYYAHDDIDAIWAEIIKPAIFEVEPGTSHILNVYVNKIIDRYRKHISQIIQ